MILLNPLEYDIARPLITDCSAELSVFATLGRTNPGEVWVDSRENPTALVMRTTETTVVAGSVANAAVLEDIKCNVLDEWEVVYPDSVEWETCTEKWHPNPWLRRYMRRRLTSQKLIYTDYAAHLPEGYVLEPVTRELLEDASIENPDALRHWVDNWGRDNYFARGAGFVVRQGNVLASWSVTDCVIGDRAAIGIVTDARHRRRGLGAIAAAATADYWFRHGIRELDWLCVAANKGSQAIAKKLGFTLVQEYPTYTCRPPYENDGDQTAEQWREWAAYYRPAYEQAPEKYREIMERCCRCGEITL